MKINIDKISTYNIIGVYFFLILCFCFYINFNNLDLLINEGIYGIIKNARKKYMVVRRLKWKED